MKERKEKKKEKKREKERKNDRYSNKKNIITNRIRKQKHSSKETFGYHIRRGKRGEEGTNNCSESNSQLNYSFFNFDPSI